jgi:sporulation protein YlmC with PRC-barrel domain
MKRLSLAAFCIIAALTPSRRAAAQVAGEATLGVTVEELKLVVLGWSVKRDLLDKDVYNDKKEDIGEVKDVVVSPEGKSVSWAIIGVGGFLGIGERLVAIPMDHLKIENGKFVLKGATKEVLKAMPPFHYRARTT